jgi:hypothetical protein
MTEESLQRAGQEATERPRSGLPLRLVGKAAEEDAAAPESSESAPGAKYALARVNLIMLDSAGEEPDEELLGTEFSFEQGDVGSVVIHTCMTGNNRQSAHGWLFESREPDLLSERPVGELAISSAGVSSITSGCPSDYDAVRVRVFPDPVKAVRRARARSTAAILLTALAVTFIVPWVALIVVADRNLDPERARKSGLAVAPPVSTAAVELPLPIVLPTPTPLPQAAEAVVEKPVKPRAPSPPQKKVVARAIPEKPRIRDERAVEPPKVVQGASRVEAPVREQPRIVLAQRAAPVVVESGAQRLAREQALCDDRGFVGQAFCREGARWKHCHPDKWDVAPECMVKADTMQ